MILRPKIFNPKKIIAAQSTRLGGVSPAPFNSMNLGLSVKDDEKNVMENRELFFGALDIDLSRISKGHQVHDNKIIAVDEPGAHYGFDAQITDQKNLFLVVSVADCTPILIHDEKNKAVAAIHAGWRGTAGRIVALTLEKMKAEYGTNGKDCKAFIGACISYPNFEVGEEVAVHFDESVKRYAERKQKWFVDLKAANKQQLVEAGVLHSNIEITHYCTVAHNDKFFSHRKEKGVTGRMMAVIGMK